MIAVTGASGFVGRALVERLQSDGRAVRALTRRQTSIPGDHVVLGDMGPDTDWRSALRGVSCVVHCAARVHVMAEEHPNPDAAFNAVNAEGTRRLAEQAAYAGVKRLVYLSTVKVMGESTLPGQPFTHTSPANPHDAYARSKLEAERALWSVARHAGLEVVIVRPPLVYGPGVGANFRALVEWVSKGWPLPFGSIPNRRSLIGLGNLTDLIAHCLEHPKASGQTFLVSDGRDLSTADLVKHIAAAMNRPARMVPAPLWLLNFLGQVTGRGQQISRLTESLQLDIQHTLRTLDWHPPHSVQEELVRTIEDFPNEATV
jgi:nucleoside-diphosphate-sugar epimerase